MNADLTSKISVVDPQLQTPRAHREGLAPASRPQRMTVVSNMAFPPLRTVSPCYAAYPVCPRELTVPTPTPFVRRGTLKKKRHMFPFNYIKKHYRISLFERALCSYSNPTDPLPSSFTPLLAVSAIASASDVSLIVRTGSVAGEQQDNPLLNPAIVEHNTPADAVYGVDALYHAVPAPEHQPMPQETVKLLTASPADRVEWARALVGGVHEAQTGAELHLQPVRARGNVRSACVAQIPTAACTTSLELASLSATARAPASALVAQLPLVDAMLHSLTAHAHTQHGATHEQRVRHLPRLHTLRAALLRTLRVLELHSAERAPAADTRTSHPSTLSDAHADLDAAQPTPLPPPPSLPLLVYDVSPSPTPSPSLSASPSPSSAAASAPSPFLARVASYISAASSHSRAPTRPPSTTHADLARRGTVSSSPFLCARAASLPATPITPFAPGPAAPCITRAPSAAWSRPHTPSQEQLQLPRRSLPPGESPTPSRGAHRVAVLYAQGARALAPDALVGLAASLHVADSEGDSDDEGGIGSDSHSDAEAGAGATAHAEAGVVKDEDVEQDAACALPLSSLVLHVVDATDSTPGETPVLLSQLLSPSPAQDVLQQLADESPFPLLRDAHTLSTDDAAPPLPPSRAPAADAPAHPTAPVRLHLCLPQPSSPATAAHKPTAPTAASEPPFAIPVHHYRTLLRRLSVFLVTCDSALLLLFLAALAQRCAQHALQRATPALPPQCHWRPLPSACVQACSRAPAEPELSAAAKATGLCAFPDSLLRFRVAVPAPVEAAHTCASADASAAQRTTPASLAPSEPPLPATGQLHTRRARALSDAALTAHTLHDLTAPLSSSALPSPSSPPAPTPPLAVASLGSLPSPPARAPLVCPGLRSQPPSPTARPLAAPSRTHAAAPTRTLADEWVPLAVATALLGCVDEPLLEQVGLELAADECATATASTSGPALPPAVYVHGPHPRRRARAERARWAAALLPLVCILVWHRTRWAYAKQVHAQCQARAAEKPLRDSEESKAGGVSGGKGTAKGAAEGETEDDKVAYDGAEIPSAIMASALAGHVLCGYLQRHVPLTLLQSTHAIQCGSAKGPSFRLGDALLRAAGALLCTPTGDGACVLRALSGDACVSLEHAHLQPEEDGQAPGQSSPHVVTQPGAWPVVFMLLGALGPRDRHAGLRDVSALLQSAADDAVAPRDASPLPPSPAVDAEAADAWRATTNTLSLLLHDAQHAAHVTNAAEAMAAWQHLRCAVAVSSVLHAARRGDNTANTELLSAVSEGQLGWAGVCVLQRMLQDGRGADVATLREMLGQPSIGTPYNAALSTPFAAAQLALANTSDGIDAEQLGGMWGQMSVPAAVRHLCALLACLAPGQAVDPLPLVAAARLNIDCTAVHVRAHTQRLRDAAANPYRLPLPAGSTTAEAAVLPPTTRASLWMSQGWQHWLFALAADLPANTFSRAADGTLAVRPVLPAAVLSLVHRILALAHAHLHQRAHVDACLRQLLLANTHKDITSAAPGNDDYAAPPRLLSVLARSLLAALQFDSFLCTRLVQSPCTSTAFLAFAAACPHALEAQTYPPEDHTDDHSATTRAVYPPQPTDAMVLPLTSAPSVRALLHAAAHWRALPVPLLLRHGCIQGEPPSTEAHHATVAALQASAQDALRVAALMKTYVIAPGLCVRLLLHALRAHTLTRRTIITTKVTATTSPSLLSRLLGMLSGPRVVELVAQWAAAAALASADETEHALQREPQPPQLPLPPQHFSSSLAGDSAGHAHAHASMLPQLAGLDPLRIPDAHGSTATTTTSGVPLAPLGPVQRAHTAQRLSGLDVPATPLLLATPTEPPPALTHAGNQRDKHAPAQAPAALCSLAGLLPAPLLSTAAIAPTTVPQDALLLEALGGLARGALAQLSGELAATHDQQQREYAVRAWAPLARMLCDEGDFAVDAAALLSILTHSTYPTVFPHRHLAHMYAPLPPTPPHSVHALPGLLLDFCTTEGTHRRKVLGHWVSALRDASERGAALERLHSTQLGTRLSEEAARRAQTRRVLVLGRSNSGRHTLAKQMLRLFAPAPAPILRHVAVELVFARAVAICKALIAHSRAGALQDRPFSTLSNATGAVTVRIERAPQQLPCPPQCAHCELGAAAARLWSFSLAQLRRLQRVTHTSSAGAATASIAQRAQRDVLHAAWRLWSDRATRCLWENRAALGPARVPGLGEAGAEVLLGDGDEHVMACVSRMLDAAGQWVYALTEADTATLHALRLPAVLAADDTHASTLVDLCLGNVAERPTVEESVVETAAVQVRHLLSAEYVATLTGARARPADGSASPRAPRALAMTQPPADVADVAEDDDCPLASLLNTPARKHATRALQLTVVDTASRLLARAVGDGIEGAARRSTNMALAQLRGCDAVAHVVDLSSYAHRGARGNALLAALADVEQVLSPNSPLVRAPVVILLNKTDMFVRKLRSVPLSTCFPRYQERVALPGALAAGSAALSTAPVSATNEAALRWVKKEVCALLRRVGAVHSVSVRPAACARAWFEEDYRLMAVRRVTTHPDAFHFDMSAGVHHAFLAHIPARVTQPAVAVDKGVAGGATPLLVAFVSLDRCEAVADVVAMLGAMLTPGAASSIAAAVQRAPRASSPRRGTVDATGALSPRGRGAAYSGIVSPRGTRPSGW